MSDEFIISLGTAQDGGYPHVGCLDSCCNKVKNNPNLGNVAEDRYNNYF